MNQTHTLSATLMPGSGYTYGRLLAANTPTPQENSRSNIPATATTHYTRAQPGTCGGSPATRPGRVSGCTICVTTTPAG
jgi:hypothetical protein